MRGASAITIRRLALEFPDDLDPVLVEGCPEESYMHVGISLLLPHLEPYLIRSMRSASKHVRDPKLLADGFEAFTTALSRFSFETKLLDRVKHPAARDLFQWHLVEELEHRTVAFDVYEHVCGGYFYRLAIGLFAQWHLNRFVLRAVDAMCNVDREAFGAQYGGRAQALERTRTLRRQKLTLLVPNVVATHFPWYSPHKIDMPEAARALADHYAARSGL
jgi:uncharacterized protein